MLSDPGFRRAAVLAAGFHVLALAALSATVKPSAAPSRVGGPPSFVVRHMAVEPQPGAQPHSVAPAISPANLPARPQPLAQQQHGTHAAAPPPPLPVADPPPHPAGSFAPVEYLPRSQLTVPPQAVTQVHVPFPDEVKGVVDLRVQFALFIDHLGQVQRVRLDSEVPPMFARTIQEAFLAARFTPGEVDGVPVASLIRLEVEFGTGAPR